MAQIVVHVLVPIFLLVLVAGAEGTPPGIANNPSHASCQIKKYKLCYNLEHVCPKFCPDGCTVECASCKPICIGGANPPPSSSFTPLPSLPTPTPSTPKNPPLPHPSTPTPSPSPPTTTPSIHNNPPPSTPTPSPSPPTPSTPENPPPSTPISPPSSPTPSTPESPPAPSPSTPSTPENPPPSTPSTPESPPPPSPSTPSTPENPPPSAPTSPPSSPTPSTPESPPPSPSTPSTPENPPSSTPSPKNSPVPPSSSTPPIPSTPSENSPPSSPTPSSPSPTTPSPPENPPPTSSTPPSQPPTIPLTPENPPSTSSTPPSPLPHIPLTPENPPPTSSTPPSPHTPENPTPSTPSQTPASPSTPPTQPSTSPSSPSPPSTSTPSPTPPGTSSPKKARCKNKNYPKCYNMEHACPNACPGGCEVDCVTCKPVCKCDRPGAVCQDPRFIGGDGITFYFHGKKDSNFCLVSDPNLHINAHFIGRRNHNMKRDFTWVQSIAILFDNHQLFIGAHKTSTWQDSIDRLALSFDGQPIDLLESEAATWKSPGFPSVHIVRISNTNNVIIEVEGKLRITAKVVPITEEESRIHNYGITKEDCFAHLDLGFKFLSLTNQVSGVLGQTYKPNYVSRVNIGAKMPIMGGEKEFETTSLFTPDCSVARFVGKNEDNYEVAMEMPSLKCGSGIGGQGVVCKR